MIDPTPQNPHLHQQDDAVARGKVAIAALVTLVFFTILLIWGWRAVVAHTRAYRPSGLFPEQHLGPRRDVSEVVESLYGDVGRGEQVNRRARAAVERGGLIPIEEAEDLVVKEAR